MQERLSPVVVLRSIDCSRISKMYDAVGSSTPALTPASRLLNATRNVTRFESNAPVSAPAHHRLPVVALSTEFSDIRPWVPGALGPPCCCCTSPVVSPPARSEALRLSVHLRPRQLSLHPLASAGRQAH